MLKKIYLENFKSFQKLDDLDLKPITIICGTNSCGKSSILQSVMTMKQTFESQMDNQSILLNGKYAHLGSYRNIVFEKKNSNYIVMKYSFLFDKNNSKFEYKHFLRSIANAFPEDDVDLNDAILSIEIKFKSKNKRGKRIFIKPIIIHEFKLDIVFKSKTKKEENYETNITFSLAQGETYDISWENVKPIGNIDENFKSTNSSRVICEFDNLVPRIRNVVNGHNQNIGDLLMLFWRYSDIMSSIFNKFSYIGPLREEASRRYIYENEITEIGVKGENAAYLYLREGEKDLEKVYFYDKEKEEFSYKKTKLEKAVNEWLKYLGIKGFASSLDNEIIHLNLDANEFSDIEINIADVGFGISQVFPIILEGLRINEHDTLLLEQPEIHLHPKMQMDIADYFISLAKSNKNMIIETHSEHMINRLIRRILEDNKNEISNLINIYFVSPTDKGSKIEKVEIDPLRGIKNWPKDFFDQSAVEQEKILIAGLNKRKRERNKRRENQ